MELRVGVKGWGKSWGQDFGSGFGIRVGDQSLGSELASGGSLGMMGLEVGVLGGAENRTETRIKKQKKRGNGCFEGRLLLTHRLSISFSTNHISLYKKLESSNHIL